jgi:hypothetical protein
MRRASTSGGAKRVEGRAATLSPARSIPRRAAKITDSAYELAKNQFGRPALFGKGWAFKFLRCRVASECMKSWAGLREMA